MAQRFCATIPSIPARRLDVGAATKVILTSDLRVIWADGGGTDTIPRGTATGAFDQTADDWLICTTRGSGTLTAIAYSNFATVFSILGGDGAILFWSTWGALLVWQQ